MCIDSSEAELKKAGKFKRHARYSEGHFHKKAYPHCSYAIWNSHTAPYLFPIASIFSILVCLKVYNSTVIIMSSKKGSTWWLLNPHSDLLGQAIQLDFFETTNKCLATVFLQSYPSNLFLQFVFQGHCFRAKSKSIIHTFFMHLSRVSKVRKYSQTVSIYTYLYIKCNRTI